MVSCINRIHPVAEVRHIAALSQPGNPAPHLSIRYSAEYARKSAN